MAENPRIEELRRRVQADPASIAFAALAEEFRRVGRYDETIDTCRTGLERHPAYLSARVTLGRALIETGHLDAAREELETVLRSAPENLAAIRGLAQIHEKLGQSSEMDPHLADMMKTMHAESIRVGAQPPPEPPPAAPAPALSPVPSVVEGLAPQPAPEPAEPEFSMAPLDDAPFDDPQGRRGRPEPAASVEAPTDPFAGFAPMSTPAPVHDFSFDLGAALTRAPAPDLPGDASFDGAQDRPFDGAQDRPFDGAQGRPFDAAQDGPFDVPIAPVVEPEPELRMAGPDPEVLATLARLERFLGAIHSLRA